jgi:uncharacterized protein
LTNWYEYLLIGLTAMLGGAVNALAGGGTLITFPMLTFVGIPAVAANVTNTVALCPGYLGATLAQLKDLNGQKERLLWFVPASIIGGILGGVLLLNTGEKMFRILVPYLILMAAGLLAVGDPLRSWLVKRGGYGEKIVSRVGLAAIPIGLAAVYGGYFGAGLSVIVLAVLGVILFDNLTRLNALKQAIAFSTNIAAAIFFLFSGEVVWNAAGVMAIFALLGGTLGGRLASRIKPGTLRKVVVVIGVVVACIYLIRG